MLVYDAGNYSMKYLEWHAISISPFSAFSLLIRVKNYVVDVT